MPLLFFARRQVAALFSALPIRHALRILCPGAASPPRCFPLSRWRLLPWISLFALLPTLVPWSTLCRLSTQLPHCCPDAGAGSPFPQIRNIFAFRQSLNQVLPRANLPPKRTPLSPTSALLRRGKEQPFRLWSGKEQPCRLWPRYGEEKSNPANPTHHGQPALVTPSKPRPQTVAYTQLTLRVGGVR